MSPPGVSSPTGGEPCLLLFVCHSDRLHSDTGLQCLSFVAHVLLRTRLLQPLPLPTPQPFLPPLLALTPAGPHLCPSAGSTPAPLPRSSLPGPSSPRGNTWAHGRGTIAEAAANALSKGSPRGVTPNHSDLALAAALEKQAEACRRSGSVSAIQAKLQKLTVSCGLWR